MIKRSDLNSNSLEYESMWIEIKNKRSKIIVIASIHRHPHNNFKYFFQYLEKCLNVVAQENKDLYVCGDFNFGLLKLIWITLLNIYLTFSAALDSYHMYSNPQG